MLVGAAQAGAAALAFVLYYSHYLGVFGKQTATAPGEVSGLAQTFANFGNLDEIMARVQLTLRHGFLLDYSVWPLALAPVGLVLLFRRGRSTERAQELSDSAQSMDEASSGVDRGLSGSGGYCWHGWRWVRGCW